MVLRNSHISKKILLSTTLIFLLIISTASVLALSFETERTNINFRISPDESAEYTIKVNNFLEEEDRYTISLSIGDSANWVSTPSSVRVPARSSEEFILKVYPKKTTPIGVYTLSLNMKSHITGETKTLSIPVHMSYDGLFFDFTPNVKTTLLLPEKADPRQNIKAEVRLENRNPLNIENAEIRIRSDLFSGNEDIKIKPGPYDANEFISKEFIFEVDPLQRPGSYEVTAEVYDFRTNKVISSEKQTLNIEGYSSTPSKIDTTREWLFIVKDTITVENFGNRETKAEIKLASNWFKNLFSTTSPKAEVIKIEGETSFLWEPTLEPTEQKTLTVKTNYWPPIIIIIITLLIIFLYFKLRSPVILEKEAMIIDEDVGEGSSDIKVRLFLRNRSGSSVNNVSVIDKVRGITDYVESTQLGHVKPSRTTKTTKKGTMLYWDIEELEPYEERIFTYKLKSKLKVVGELTLPNARVKFEKNNKEKKVLSKKPMFRKVKKKKEE